MAFCEAFSGKDVLIIGAGAFGSSTALALAEHPFPPSTITVLDRSETPGPAPDAASTDISKITRSDYWYSDLYSTLGAAAITRWKGELYSPAFHPCGLLFTETSGGVKHPYTAGDPPGSSRKGYERSKRLYDAGKRLEEPIELPTRHAQQAVLPEDLDSLPTSSDDCYGYLNKESGWSDASLAMSLLVKRAQHRGVRYVSAVVVEVDDSGDRVELRSEDGRYFKGDLCIVAAGAWLPSLLPELDGPAGMTPTGQVVATIKLEGADIERYAKMPVVLDLRTDFFLFPPNRDGLVKIVLHSCGYTFKDPVTDRSRPYTAGGSPDGAPAQGNIPAEAAIALRESLALIFPGLARRPFHSTRLCHYAESSDSDFIIDRHPSRPKLVICSGDSGHAFKFLPVLGDLVVQRLEGTLPAEQAEAFSATRKRGQSHRVAKRRPLVEMRMAGEEELAAHSSVLHK